MNAVQQIKAKYDMDALLRAIAPAARKRQEGRKKRERTARTTSRINARLAEVGIPWRVV